MTTIDKQERARKRALLALAEEMGLTAKVRKRSQCLTAATKQQRRSRLARLHGLGNVRIEAEISRRKS